MANTFYLPPDAKARLDMLEAVLSSKGKRPKRRHTSAHSRTSAQGATVTNQTGMGNSPTLKPSRI